MQKFFYPSSNRQSADVVFNLTYRTARLLTAGGLLAALAMTTVPANACADGVTDCVAVESPQDTTRAGDFNAREDDTEAKATTMSSRLLDIAKHQDIPDVTMAELTRAFAYEFDLDRPVRPGDAFRVLYGTDRAPAALLAAELVLQGQVHKLYRFTLPDGTADYYDDAGRSWRTRLERKPLAAGDLASGFGMHTHPILGYSRMHTGVDWAAQTGTQVYAAGDGQVVQAEWSGSEGNKVRLANTDGFETGYLHLEKIAPGLHPGVRVRQGQVIGSVGSTGLSTGPHLHYEILYNGRYVDPLRVKLAPARELYGAALKAFMSERNRLDEQLRQTPPHELAPLEQPL
jgi:murein DD-endopeptidase MepM/ murein hydrolase activator NlpD